MNYKVQIRAVRLIDLVFTIATLYLLLQQQWVGAGICWILSEEAGAQVRLLKIELKLDIVTGFLLGHARETAAGREEKK